MQHLNSQFSARGSSTETAVHFKIATCIIKCPSRWKWSYSLWPGQTWRKKLGYFYSLFRVRCMKVKIGKWYTKRKTFHSSLYQVTHSLGVINTLGVIKVKAASLGCILLLWQRYLTSFAAHVLKECICSSLFFLPICCTFAPTFIRLFWWSINSHGILNIPCPVM